MNEHRYLPGIESDCCQQPISPTSHCLQPQDARVHVCPVHGETCDGATIYGKPIFPSDPIWRFHRMGGCRMPSPDYPLSDAVSAGYWTPDR